jgi:hypothetical protein
MQFLDIFKSTCYTSKIAAISIILIGLISFSMIVMNAPMIALSFLFLDMSIALMTLVSFDMICSSGYERSLQLILLLVLIGNVLQILSISNYKKQLMYTN